MLKPKSTSKSIQKWLIWLVACGGTGYLALLLSRDELTLISFIQTILLTLLVACIFIWANLEESRARSIEISEMGVSGLNWRMALGIIPAGLARTTLPWKDVKDVARSGFVLVVSDGRRRVTINTYLFENPDEAFKIVGKHVSDNYQ